MRRLVRLRANGYASIEGLQAASALPRNALERLAEADAFWVFGLGRRGRLCGRCGRWKGSPAPPRRPARMTTAGPISWPRPCLFAWHADDGLFRHEPEAALPAMAPSETVADDYATTSLSLRGHPVAFFRDRLIRIGAVTARAHLDPALAQGAWVTVAGIVLVRQRPGTAKGVVSLPWRTRRGSPTSWSGRRCSRRTAGRHAGAVPGGSRAGPAGGRGGAPRGRQLPRSDRIPARSARGGDAAAGRDQRFRGAAPPPALPQPRTSTEALL